METELLGFVATGGSGGRWYQKTLEGPFKTTRGNRQGHILNTTIADGGDLEGIDLWRVGTLTFFLQITPTVANVGTKKRG